MIKPISSQTSLQAIKLFIIVSMAQSKKKGLEKSAIKWYYEHIKS